MREKAARPLDRCPIGKWEAERPKGPLLPVPAALPSAALSVPIPTTGLALRLWKELASHEPYPEGRFSGRGVVLVGGGRYAVGVYCTLRILRQLGCHLPVEVWYLGPEEYEPWMRWMTAGLGEVRWIDALAVQRERGIVRRKPLGGWELKAFALRHTRFEQVLYMDADCYPAQNPEPLFDQLGKGAIFWPDLEGSGLGWVMSAHWQLCGIPERQQVRDLESGQLLLDKSRCWKALTLCDFLNDDPDVYTVDGRNVRGIVYGDKTTFALAWWAADPSATTESPPYRLMPAARMEAGTILQHVPAEKEGGAPVIAFCHRIHDKPFIEGYRDKEFVSNQCCGGSNARHPNRTMPMEDALFDARDELAKLLAPLGWWIFAADGDDLERWQAAALKNVWRLPNRVVGAVVDTEADLGQFAWACRLRGATGAWCCEANDGRAFLLGENLPRMGFTRAVARVRLRPHAPGDAPEARPATLREVLTEVLAEVPSVRMLKLGDEDDLAELTPETLPHVEEVRCRPTSEQAEALRLELVRGGFRVTLYPAKGGRCLLAASRLPPDEEP